MILLGEKTRKERKILLSKKIKLTTALSLLFALGRYVRVSVCWKIGCEVIQHSAVKKS